MKEMLRCMLKENGALYVMMDGTEMMLWLYADNLVIVMLEELQHLAFLEMELGVSNSMIWNALEMKVHCLSALITVLAFMTAFLLRLLEWSVEVTSAVS